MKKLFAILLLTTSLTITGQVGINTTTPDTSSMLDITSTDKGILVPRMIQAQRTAIVTPATSLLVYQTDASAGFWYYNGTAWVNLNSNSGEFKSIAGLVQNTTNTAADDFVFGSTSLADIAGTNDDSRVFFDKSKGAFRAGQVTGTQWNDANVGTNSTALGLDARASGSRSTATGYQTTASGLASTAIGIQTTASGQYATAIGSSTQATGTYAIAMGNNNTSSGYTSTTTGEQTIASGDFSTAAGYRNTAPSYAETALGTYATNYTPVSATAFDVNDRIFSVGNGTSNAARSNALTILKNGSIGVGTSTPTASALLDLTSTSKGILVPRMTAAQRTAIATPATSLLVYQTDVATGFWYYNGTAWVNLNSGGEFKSIGGLVQNTTNTAADDFVFGSTSLADIAGTNDDNRMFFNKSKGAFRAGGVDGTKWNDANVGINSIALGYNSTASGPYSMAMGRETLASGYQATAMSYYTTASGDHSSAMSYYTTASGWASTAMGILTTASGTGAVSMGQRSVASGNHAVALGTYNTAPSYGELVVGNYATNYTAADAVLANPADRLFSVGNGTSDVARSNAITILKDGKVGIGTDTPNASALLDLTSTNKGMLVPRMTAAQRTAIATPATSLLVYQTDAAAGFWYYNGSAWVNLNSSGEFKSIGGLVQNTTDTTADDFVFGSTSLADIVGTNDDNRMFFDKSKGAFRAGQVTGVQWDNANVGANSTAFGYNTTASGSNSTVLGYNTTASGLYATAMGINNFATGNYSTSLGSSTQATGSFSTTLGSGTVASGSYSTATGINNTASGDASIVMGYNNTSSSFAETVLGSYATTYAPVSSNAFNAADRIFSVGNGTSSASRSNAMTVLKNGRVGIGTDSPTKGLLEINGVGLGQGTLTVISHGNGAGTTALATLNGGTYGASAYSIWASGNIAGTQFHAYSDARIKKIAGVSNTANDLQTLEKIEITNYKMVDSLQQGNKPIKKVIAQQIEKVYPQAVANNLTEVIPNIYKVSQIKNGWIDLAADVKVGDKIKLLFDTGEKLVTVTEVSAKGFKVNVETEGSVFVYGKEVHDFRAVDYEALSMLNISATQELLKRIKELEAEKDNLYNKMQSLENDQAKTNSRLEQLEDILLKNKASADKPITSK